MFDCVLHTMYINFSMIHCIFAELAFMMLFILFSMMNDSDFMSISTCKQFFIFSFNNTFVIYEV